MEISRFRNIVASFVDSPDQLELKKGSLAIQLGTDVITAKLQQTADGLVVIEGGVSHRAQQWIIRRLAQLDSLAERIISTVPNTPNFVVPNAEVLGRIDEAPTDEAVHAHDAVESLEKSLSLRPGGTCSVLYLTSDAGEGKTTVINRLAQLQASRFRQRGSDWLLVPIALGGRPFLRFEDVVVAALMNQLRFQRLYFDSFVELVRMGALIPALDGFEEVFVETSEGDAVSSLGTLIRQMGGEGTLLIAARKAYFEFKRLETQAKLLDALPNVDVEFSRITLHRWGHEEFVTYAVMSGIRNAEQLYTDLVARVSPDHPLLTRPVLVKRLVDIAKSYEDFSFVASIQPETETFFIRFIDRILEREANDKWIDKFGDPPTSLLSLAEHHQLLGYIAEEMWVSKTSLLSGEMFDSLAEIFCETAGKSPAVTRQVRERIKQHALIVASSTNRKEFGFDHENFREFFLGEQIGWHLQKNRSSDVRKMMRSDLIHGFTLDTAFALLRSQQVDLADALKAVQDAARAEGPSSYVRENAGGLAVRMLEQLGEKAMVIEDLVFPLDALQGRTLRNIEFRKCYFRGTSLSKSTLNKCRFFDCEFERIELDGNHSITGCELGKDTVIRTLSIVRNGETDDFYDPRKVAEMLLHAGFTNQEPQLNLQLQAPTLDRKLAMLQKAVHAFQRSTQVNLGTFRLRLSIHATEFFDEVFPDLIAAGILVEAPKAAGRDKYRLGLPFGVIAQAMRDSEGSYARCLELIRTAGRSAHRIS